MELLKGLELHPIDVHAMVTNAILKDESVLKVDTIDTPWLLPENLKAAVNREYVLARINCPTIVATLTSSKGVVFHFKSGMFNGKYSKV